MAWPFKKKDPELEEIPEEVQDYYEAERKQRASVAWTLAFFSLILTLVVATGAFYGGRAIYRRVKNNDNATQVATQSPTEPALPEIQTQSTPEADVSLPEAAVEPSQPQSTAAPAPPPPQPSVPAAEPQTQPAQTQPQVAGSAANDLPNTGPANFVGIFVIAALISTASYHLVATKSRN